MVIIATYKVYRDGVLISSPTTRAFVDTNLANDVTYGYQVSAVTSAGEGPKTNTVYATPSAGAVIPPTPVTSILYGSAIAADTKSNIQIGWTNRQKVAHRFRATQTSTITGVRFSQRGGAVYSGGTGGTCRVSIQADSSGVPDGHIIGSSGSITPGNPGDWTTFNNVTVSAGVTAGNLYYAVFENTDADPVANYFSVNEIYTYSHLTPRQPSLIDADYAVLVAGPTTWVLHQETAVMDITYANTAHDGMGYIQNMIDKYAIIQGANLCREHFTVSGGDRTVGSLYVRVRRTSGNSNLILNLKQGSTILRTVSVPASAITTPTAPGGDNGGSVWVGGTFFSLVLSNGVTYDVELSTAVDTQYTAAPIRKGTSTATSGNAFNSALYFNDGVGQFSTNSGSSWADMYAFDSPDPDIQFFIGPYVYVGPGITPPAWWIAPSTSGTVNLTGLDTTGATDMTSAIQAQIDAAADNRIIQFPAGTLKISSAINYHGRHNLIFDGTGCTINNVANANTGDSNLKCTFFTRFSETAATHITIRNFHITAASPSPGVFQSGEFAAALGAQKGSYIEFYNNTCTGLFGDMVTLNENPDHVWIHENNVVNCGRHMLSVICADTVMCESNTMGISGYGVFDIEQEPGSVAGALNITFRNNVITSYGINTFCSINGVNSDHPTHDIVVTGNTVTGKALRMYSIYTTVNRVQRLTFSNNTSHSSLGGPIFNFDYIDVLVVQNNDQTHTGTLISVGIHCTGVTVNGNTAP